ncbi:MAG: S1C family serine protease [Aeoliella sp.]
MNGCLFARFLISAVLAAMIPVVMADIALTQPAAPVDAKPQTAESPPPAVEWNDEIEAVLEKRHPENLAELKLIQTQLQRVAQHATPATVAVRVGGAFGSAVIVSPDGVVLTAGHVVGRPKQPVTFVFPDGSTAKGETLGMNREIDSGMMKITDPGPWPFVEIADAKNIRSGEWVVTIGQPGGFDSERTPPVRLGRVLFANNDVINTDCTLVGGDSGGPLLNMRGELVGIHSRIGRRITNNFHVPISTYHSTLDRLAAAERWGGPLDSSEPVETRPMLGVAGDPLGDDCRITQVFPGMPAAQAGLKVGDVVSKFDGQGVETFRQLGRLVMAGQPGEKVQLEVVRGEEKLEIEVVLAQVRQTFPGSPDKADESESKD